MNYTPLARAVLAHDLPSCNRLLNDGAQVNTQMELGVTALHLACMVPVNVGIMEALLNNGADVEIENVHEMTPFKVACREHDFEQAELLLRYGSNINKTDKNGNTALHDSLKYNHGVACEFLCSKGANVNMVNVLGDTPLSMACVRGYTRVASVLISRGAFVNYIHPSEPEQSILLLGITHGEESLVRLLIKKHADVLYTNRDSENALFLACRLNRAAALRILCTELIGIDLDMRQNVAEGYTALMVAAKHNALEAAQVLLEHSCDLWIQSTSLDQPLTAYMLAVQCGHNALAALIDSFANPPTTRLY